MLHYRFAEEKDLQDCVELLTDSFFDYPYFSNFIEENEKRRDFVRSIQSIAVGIYYGKQRMMLAEENGEILAVAAIQSPRDKGVEWKDYVSKKALQTFLIGGIFKTLSWISMTEKAEKVIHSQRKPYWYLGSLAVKNNRRGEGIGGRFLKEGVIPYVAGEGGEQFTLLTNTESNARFYEKAGFSLLSYEELQTPKRRMGNWSYYMDVRTERGIVA